MAFQDELTEGGLAADDLAARGLPHLDLTTDQPLGSQVYHYLRELLRTEALKPGTSIQTGTLARSLGVSKTPLRDALIQLQTEGFLKILPQRGVVISTLDARELRDLIQVLGGLESKAMMLAFPHLGPEQVGGMKAINASLRDLLPEGRAAYREYNRLNIAFHDVFLERCGNALMLSQIRTLKLRMYHFPDRDYGDAWRKLNCDEHQQIIDFIEKGEDQMAADFMRDVHWSFDRKKPKLKQIRLPGHG